MMVIIFVQKNDTQTEGTALKSPGSYLEFSQRTIQKLSLLFGSLKNDT